MDLDRLDAWLERLIFVLVVAALGFGIVAFGATRVPPGDFLVVEALVALSAILWLIRIWAVRSHRLLWPPVSWGVLAFAGWAVWRWTAADLEYTARDEVLRILTYTALFLVVVNNLHRQSTAQGLAWFLIGLATLLCFYGVWQFVSAKNTVWGLGRAADYVHRASGSYACPNHFAGLLELLLPLALVFVIAGRMSPLGRILLGYAGVVMLAGLGLSFSRGGWLAAGLGLAWVLIVLARHRDFRFMALGCLAALVLLGGVAVGRTQLMKKRIEAAHDLDPQSRNSRPNIWRATLAMCKDHLWLGVGPAHFNERFKQYRTSWVHGEPGRAHNDYLNALADWGVAGTTLAVIPWLLLGYGTARTLRQVQPDPGNLEARRSSRYALVVGISGGLIALLAHSVTDFNWHIPGNALVGVTWMALLTGYSRYATDDWWVSSRRPWRVAITLLILALITALAWDLAWRGRETMHLLRANRAELGSQQMAELEMAWRIEPANPWTASHIGDVLRVRSFQGEPGYETVAEEALGWFEKAARVDPFDPTFRIRAGMCLDWLDRHAEAEKHFQEALRLDPEGRITSFYMGWHELQKGNEPAAREWFLKSVQQGWPPYEPALRYLQLLESRGAVRSAPNPSP